MQFVDVIPDAEALCALEPDELGLRMLPVLAEWERLYQATPLSLDNFIVTVSGRKSNYAGQYERKYSAAVELAVREAWAWLDDRPAAQPRRGGRRVPGDRGREHGQRDQEDFGAARLRRDQVRARHVRRGRGTARLRGGRRARHHQGPHPPPRRGAVRLRNGPGRHHRHAGEGGGGAARRPLARRTRPGRGPPGGRRARRAGRGRHRSGAGGLRAAGAPALRGHRHRAAGPAGHHGRDDRRLRAGLPAAVLVPDARQDDPRGGGIGRGDRGFWGDFPETAPGFADRRWRGRRA